MQGLKLKISAAAVAMNAVMALALIGSTPAQAQSCAARVGCIPTTLCANVVSICQGGTPAGCTYTGAFCGGVCEQAPISSLSAYGCFYQ